MENQRGTIITGKQGSGKTTLGKRMLTEHKGSTYQVNGFDSFVYYKDDLSKYDLIFIDEISTREEMIFIYRNTEAFHPKIIIATQLMPSDLDFDHVWREDFVFINAENIKIPGVTPSDEAILKSIAIVFPEARISNYTSEILIKFTTKSITDLEFKNLATLVNAYSLSVAITRSKAELSIQLTKN